MTKGDKIVEYFLRHPDATRRQVAEAVGCTVARVGEVVRAGRVQSAQQQKTKRRVRSAVRHERCQHEKARKTRTGSCRECPPYEAA